MTSIFSDDGSMLSIKEYSRHLFQEHSDKAEWLTTFESNRTHFVIESSDFSPSICNRVFITKDLINPDDLVPPASYMRCRQCEKALEKLTAK